MRKLSPVISLTITILSTVICSSVSSGVIAQSTGCSNYWVNPATGKQECLGTGSSQTQETNSPRQRFPGYEYLGQLDNSDLMYVKLETSRKRFGYREVSVKVRVIEQSPNPSQTFTSMVVNCDRKELTIKLIIRSKAGKLINSNDYGGGIVKPNTRE